MAVQYFDGSYSRALKSACHSFFGRVREGLFTSYDMIEMDELATDVSYELSAWQGRNTVTFCGDQFMDCLALEDTHELEIPDMPFNDILNEQYVVEFSVQLDKAMIKQVNRKDGIEEPTLHELKAFVEEKRRFDARLKRLEEDENKMWGELFALCRDSRDVLSLKRSRRRHGTLYYKYRAILYMFIIRRHKKAFQYYRDEWVPEQLRPYRKDMGTQTVYAVPEADNEAVHGFGDTTTNEASNVTLVSQRDSSQCSTAIVPSIRWSQYVSNDVVDDFRTVTDRWFNIGTFEWNTSQQRNTNVFVKRIGNRDAPYVLPYDIIHTKGEEVCDMPNLLPFRAHAYWRGDIELKILLNSNKFQIGQLQVSFYYQSEYDDDIATRVNVFTMSQIEHSLVSASASNEVTLYIPYKHVFPFIACSKVSNITLKRDILNLGTLYILVLNPLKTTSTGPKKCTGSVMARFVSSEFTGMRHGSLFVEAQAEMEMVGAMAALKLLDTVMPAANMDNPPYVQAPAYVVPTASHSWSLGNNVAEPLHALRLDARGQVRHIGDTNSVHQMTVQDVASHYGLCETVEWSKGRARGYQLLSRGVSPFVQQRATGSGYWTTYYMAPVGVISSLFMQWRGSLEFKFDIVASQFHTGRLMIGYVPGASSNDNMSMGKLRASPHMVFDLQESRTFVYEVPYVSYAPWVIRNVGTDYQGNVLEAPSMLYMYVFNDLVNMESIPDSVYINIYIRAGKSFEVSVPIQPALALGWNTDFKSIGKEEYHAIKGYAPYYAGYWHRVGDGKVLVFRWGTASDQVAEFDTVNTAGIGGTYNSIYYSVKDVTKMPKYVNKAGRLVTIQIMVAARLDGYTIGIPVLNEYNARKLSYQYYVAGKAITDSTLTPYMITVDDTSKNTWSVGNPTWLRIEFKEQAVTDNVIEAQPQGEELVALDVIPTPNTLISTNWGQDFFGENFNDLKNLCRRYQYYGQILLSESVDRDSAKCAFYFPVLPQGLELDLGQDGDVNELANRCRDGTIPIVASAFRYYRGSIRFRLVFPKELDTMIWVQHRPDRPMRTLPVVTACTKLETSQSVYNHGYASYLQYCKVNNIVEFEVPYYNRSSFNYLQRPNLDGIGTWTYSLGEVAVGIQATREDVKGFSGKYCTIYYSLGDDHMFSQWVGFPSVMRLDGLPSASMIERVVAQPEMGWFDILKSPTDTIQATINDTVLSSANVVIDAGMNEVKSVVADVLERVRGFIDNNHIEVNSAMLTQLISQFGHMIISPTIATVAWSFASILLNIGVFAVTSFNLVINTAGKFLETFVVHLRDALPEPKIKESVVMAQPEGPKEPEEKEIAAQWVGVLFMGLSSVLKSAVKKPKDISEWIYTSVKDLGDNARSSNQIVAFIRNTFDVLQKIWRYIIGRRDDAGRLLAALESDEETIKAWATEVLYLTEPAVKRQLTGKADYANRVYEASVYGQLIISGVSQELRTEKNCAIILRLYDKIILLREELLAMGENPYIRKLPFTIYMVGEPGIGKSFLSTNLCAKLLKAARIKSGDRGLKCTINPQSDFWDQCDHQPVLEIDDLFAVTTSQALEKQLCTLFQVCSPIVLSPPKAALEDKKMRYNPEIFYINSNKAFPSFNDTNDRAIWRRRNVLIQARLSQIVKPNCPHCDKDKFPELQSIEDVDPRHLSDFHHLDFAIAECVTDPNTTYSEWMGYDALEVKLIKQFKANREREYICYRNRVEVCEGRPVTMTPATNQTLDEAYHSIRAERILRYREIEEATLAHDLGRIWDKVPDKVRDPIQASYEMFKNGIINTLASKTPVFLTRRAQPQSDINPFDDEETIFERASTSEATLPDVEEIVYTNTALYRYEWLDKLVEAEIMSETYAAVVKKLMDELCDYGDFLEDWSATRKPMFEYVNMKRVFGYNTLDDLMLILMQARSPCTSLCRHEQVCLKKTLFLDGKILETNVSFDYQDSCGDDCIFNSPVLKYIWYKLWLRVHPVVQWDVQCRKAHRVPRYYMGRSVVDDFCVDTWYAKFGMAVKAFWYKYISPALSMLYQFLFKIAPFIASILFCSAILARPVMEGVASYHDAKSSEAVRREVETKGYAAVFGEQTQWSAPEAAVRYDTGTPGSAAPLRSAPVVSMPQGVASQVDVVSQLVERQTIFLVARCMGVELARYRGVMIGGRKCLFLRHYIEALNKLLIKWQSELLVSFQYAKDNATRIKGGEIVINYGDCKTTYFGGRDASGVPESNLCVLQLPLTIPEARSLVKFFATKEMHKFASTQGRLVVPGGQNYLNLRIDYNGRVPHTIAATSLSEEVVLDQCYTYAAHAPGFCGSLLLAENLERPVVGIHVAGVTGSNGYGMAEILALEMFEDLPTYALQKYADVAEMTAMSLSLDDIHLDTCVFPYGKVPKQLAQAQSGKTNIVPSLIAGVFPIRTEPNPVNARDRRLPEGSHPLYDGCSKHGLVLPDFPEYMVELATDHLQNVILSNVKPIRQNPGKLGLQEVVCGHPNIPEFEALNMASSAGFPMNSTIYSKDKNSKMSGKRWCFELDDSGERVVLKGLHPDLERLCSVTHKMREAGIKPVTVFNDCLKDTTLPKEKCRVRGKTRIFSISPLQYTLEFKKYFSDFMASYRRTRLQCESGIGINPDGPEWVQLASHLSRYGSCIVTGDYKNFGPGLHLRLAHAAFEIIIQWYEQYTEQSEVDGLVRSILAAELIGALHLCEDMVYRVPCGIPSGSPITDILNSLVNCLYIRIAYLSIFKTLDNFNDNVVLVTYGDDLIMNVTPTCFEKFNTIAIAEFFSQYGMSFTDQDKSEAQIRGRTLATATFLKRGFKQHPHDKFKLLAPLDLISVQGCANWVNKKLDPIAATSENAIQSCMLAYGHGPQYYAQHKAAIQKALQKRGICVVLPSWESLDENVWK